MVVAITVTAFWDVMFCTLVEVYQNLGGTWCPHFCLRDSGSRFL